jgi:LysR family glycine cleavage system transcriptional activator
MNWKDIPSLAALRAFEATARLDGYSAAARELNVTHAAIAQHVRGLETFFGQTLMVRQGRGMGLTAAGHRLAASVSEGFGVIEAGVAATRRAREDAPLKIALTPTFAENWLMPRLGAFWAENPMFSLALVPGFEVVDLKRDDFDLAIRYGHGNWPGVRSEHLVAANYVVVGTPALVEGLKVGENCDLAELKGKPWVMPDGRDEEKLWAKANGLDLDGSQGSRIATNSLVLSAVRSGVGLSIQARALVQDDLASGALVCLCEEPASTLGYYIVTRDGVTSDRLTVFLKWLRSIT